MKEILNYLYHQKTLERNEAGRILTNIAKGEYNNSQIASFISVFLMRGITVDELSGFRDALLDLCIRVDLSDFNTIDMCGTGGDGKDTFNISTLSVFVVAGAGYKVAKHGNYAVSSSCGSSNVMESLGYTFTQDPSQLKNEIDKSNVCFLHAPLFNPAMKNVAPVRKELGVKTFFNMLGPMVNPSFPKNQMVGVYSQELARLYNYLYQQGDKNFVIVHSRDGYDEVSLTADITVIKNEGENVLKPKDFKSNYLHQKDLHGGKNIEESKSIFLSVLNNSASPAQKAVVIANSALAIQCMDKNSDLSAAIEKAKESIESGQALQALKKLIEINNSK